ncbi:anaerobic glycerol-3-phosphate dehydrogenase subunit B [Halobacteria archaeon AArc-dxtr1]|nr:anaerobic glycerol-3-phosphate dehydrogenase subunit B [Halobacteria archaeon AArc-dxtr1]
MAIEDDVLVIGGGLAGATAALAAADADGDARVRLVTYKQSTLRHASGLIDVLGYTPDGSGPLSDPFSELDELPSGHPYERVGAEAVREALAFFDAVTGDAYRGEHTDANALVPTSEGALKPTARYPTATAAGLASDPRDLLLVGFETLPDFDAPLAAAHLEAAGVPFDVRGVSLSFPGIRRDDAKVTRYAHLLDRNEAVAEPGSVAADGGVSTGRTDAGTEPRDGDATRSEQTARAALAGAVAPEMDGAERVGFPPILGDDHAATVRRELGERLGATVFEVPAGPPSLPGIRLEDLLYDALNAAGVRVTSGVPVVDYEASDGDDGERRIEHAVVDRKGQTVPYHASQYVLATGGLVGKGVKSARERTAGGDTAARTTAPEGQPAGESERTGVVFEPIFGCHVDHAPDRYDWFDDDVYGDHPFARYGLAVDRELRPLDADGEREFANLRAAGAVLGGYDYAAEKSGSGVSLATGYVAGRRAASEVNR